VSQLHHSARLEWAGAHALGVDAAHAAWRRAQLASMPHMLHGGERPRGSRPCGASCSVRCATQEYRPAKLSFGCQHPDPVVETASLAAVEPPDITYELGIRELADAGVLSALQLESITYACQRHEQHLPDGSRAGFFIGDGAGVGKGRTIAGLCARARFSAPCVCVCGGGPVTMDCRRVHSWTVPRSAALRLADRAAQQGANAVGREALQDAGAWRGCQWSVGRSAARAAVRTERPAQWASHKMGRTGSVAVAMRTGCVRLAGLVLECWRRGLKRHLWLSVGSDLRFDARRDLDDVGATDIDVHPLNKLPYGRLDGAKSRVAAGVVFLTYASLISASDKVRPPMQTRHAAPRGPCLARGRALWEVRGNVLSVCLSACLPASGASRLRWSWSAVGCRARRVSVPSEAAPLRCGAGVCASSSIGVC
jgi:P-loop containing NTP hydrolase pore-1